MKGLQSIRLTVAAFMLLATTGASGDSGDLLTASAGISRMRDDNLFRRPADGSLGSVSGDHFTTTRVGLKVQKPVSLQSFELNATIVDNRYDRFDELNARNDSYGAAWRWSLTPRLTGNLSVDRQQSQTDFADFRGTGQNQRTSESRRFDAAWNFMGGWFLGAGVTRKTDTNSQTFSQDASNDQRIADIMLKYAFPSGTSIDFVSSLSNGDYHRLPDPVTLSDSRFSDRRDEVRINWPLTGKTKLTANYGRVARKNENFGDRDYSGQTSGLNLSWAATSKTSLALAHSRATENWADVSSSFAVRETTSLSGNWQITTKVSLRASIDRETRTFSGFALIPASYSRRDRTDKELVALEWAALHNLTLAASTVKSRRNSNAPGLDYGDRLTTVSANASF